MFIKKREKQIERQTFLDLSRFIQNSSTIYASKWLYYKKYIKWLI